MSEVKTNKISSVSTNGDITLDPDGTGDTIVASGNLGVGTTSPDHTLTVSASSSPVLEIEQTSGGPYKTNIVLNGNDTEFRGSSGNIEFYTGNNDGASSTERMRIDSSGNVKINNTRTTSVPLQVVGGTGSGTSYDTAVFAGGQNSTSGSGAKIYLSGCENDPISRGAKIEGVATNNSNAHDLRFSVSAGASVPTERMRIDKNGSTTTLTTSGHGSAVFKTTISAGTSYNLIQAQHSSSSITNGTQCFFMTTNGNMYNTNNSYNGTSDSKLKEQIADASSQWDDIKALSVRKYKFKADVAAADTDDDSLFQLGVIAQEVETAGMNGLVTTRADRDEDGNDLGTTTKSVKYSVLYMKAVKALQEAMTRIEALETENSTQATQIADLITRVTALEDA
jgi:hypothetical protein